MEIPPGPKEEAPGPIPSRVGTERKFFENMPNPIFHVAPLCLTRGMEKGAKRNKYIPKSKYGNIPLYSRITIIVIKVIARPVIT